MQYLTLTFFNFNKNTGSTTNIIYNFCAIFLSQYAMLFGTYLGGYWILKILFPLGLTIPFLSFLFVGLTLCVPFMGVLLCTNVSNHGISFLHGYSQYLCICLPHC